MAKYTVFSNIISGSQAQLVGITGSLLGTASYANTASWATNFITSSVTSASYAFTASSAVSSSYAFTASSAVSASYVLNSISSSYAFTASSAVSSSRSISSSYAFTASSAVSAFTASSAVNATNALTASSADNFVVRNSITASAALINGTLTAQTLVVSVISASVEYSSGSNRFGSLTIDQQTFTGSVNISGSLNVNGRATITDLTGSLFGTSSWATNFITSSVTSASYAFTASSAVSSSYSLTASYALNVSGTIANAISASYAFTASSAVSSSFSGNSLSASSAFTASSAVSSSFANFAISASSAFTASSAISASYILNSVSSSYAFTASSAVSAFIASSSVTSSYAFIAASGTGSFTGSFIGVHTGSLFGTASWATNFITSSVTSASYAFTASSAVSASQSISSSYAFTASSAVSAFTASSAVNATNALTASSADNFLVRNSLTSSAALVTGTLTAQTLVVSIISSSIEYSSGSNTFGNLTTDQQTFTGSVNISGSLNVNGRGTITDLTGSLFGTASWATNVLTASYFSGPTADLPSIQIRRTTSYTLTNTFTDLTFDRNDYVGNESIISHSLASNTERIYVKETGPYLIGYNYDVYQSGGSNANVETRILVNNTTVVSSSFTYGQMSSSDIEQLASSFVYSFNNGDYFTLQARYPQTTGGVIDTNAVVLNVVRLKAPKGDPGPSGSGVTISVADEGTFQGTATFLNFTGAGVTATVASNTASINIPGGAGSSFPYTGSAQITGSLGVTGSFNQSYSGSTIGNVTDYAATVTSLTYVNLGTGSLGTRYSGSSDDTSRLVSLPFSMSYLGTSYNSVYVGANSYITFGSGSTQFSNLGPSNPPYPAVLIAAADNSVQKIYTGSEDGNATFRIRFEGDTINNNASGSNIKYSYLFYNNSDRIDLFIDQIPNTGSSTSGISNGNRTSINYVANLPIFSGSSYAYTINTSGNNSIKNGSFAHVQGSYDLAIGNYSHAEGYYTTASGDNSHAEGQFTIASGPFSHAEGTLSISAATSSHAEGYNTIARGIYSHAEGADTISIGLGSHAEGSGSFAIASFSHAEGSITEASGSYSHAEGYRSRAYGIYSHAEGDLTIAPGFAAHAEGYASRATGDYSHAEGNVAQASGIYSHAEGYSTQASGYASHAEGELSHAANVGAHAEGFKTLASGQYSHAEGYFTTASGNYSHVQGTYNIADTAQSTFIIGNGVGEASRSNLVYASGSQFQITGSLRVRGDITGSLFGSSSYALTSSYAVSASYLIGGSSGGLTTKAGSVANSSFTGNPKKATVTFSTAFPNTNYAITVTGEDARSWTIESKAAGSFVINANSNTGLSGTTYWHAIAYGEA